MIISKKAFLFATLYMPFCLHAQECASSLIDWSDYDKTLKSMQTAYHSGKYSSLDNALNCLTEENSTFTSGKSGSIAVYIFFRNEMPGPGADEEDALRIKRWKENNRDSKFTRFADLRLMYAQAWNARGNKYAHETAEEQFSRFKGRLLQTELAILEADDKLRETAFTYNLLMSVALDTKGTQTSAIDTFNDGVKKWPNYYRFYEALLNRLVPKWGGSWETVDEFINQWATTLSTSEGNSLYARLYYSVHSHESIDPRKTLVKWDLLKASLIDLYTKYPVKEHFEISASYGCIFGDQELYRNMINKNNVKTSEHWLRGSSKERCDKYFNKYFRS